jgi:hypothetical protein
MCWLPSSRGLQLGLSVDEPLHCTRPVLNLNLDEEAAGLGQQQNQQQQERQHELQEVRVFSNAEE